jgi:dTDP-4-dehydrorhamnose 3,5-epimerase
VIVTPTRIPGVHVVEMAAHSDARGHFARTYCREVFAQHAIAFEPVQCNLSFNPQRGTLRGLHYQDAPYPDAKLVRCTRGAIFDVVVDLRHGSPSHGEWLGFELSEQNGRVLFVPEGCAHGFQTLTPDTELFYMMGAAYRPELARGVRWDDPAFAIAWPIAAPLLSERDATYPDHRP